MLDWTAKVFRSLIEVILWLILIVSTIIGGVIGGIIGSRYIFWGVIFGLAIGLIGVVIGGGIITNFLSLVDNVASLKKKFCEENLPLGD
jgi:hypothetical protein